jgi:hypothetical protein
MSAVSNDEEVALSLVFEPPAGCRQKTNDAMVLQVEDEVLCLAGRHMMLFGGEEGKQAWKPPTVFTSWRPNRKAAGRKEQA